MLKNLLQGRFMNHPLHPLLIHIPIGLWAASLVFDILFFRQGTAYFAITSYYCIGVGVIGALLAVPAGIAEFVDIPTHTRPKRLAVRHMTLNFLATALYIVNFFARRGVQGGPPSIVTSGTFILSCVTLVLLGAGGYLGGLLVYEYGIGSRIEDHDDSVPAHHNDRNAA